jgi:hypothetical protein
MESVESMMGGLPAFVVAKSTGGKQVGEDEDKATILLHHPTTYYTSNATNIPKDNGMCSLTHPNSSW